MSTSGSTSWDRKPEGPHKPQQKSSAHLYHSSRQYTKSSIVFYIENTIYNSLVQLFINRTRIAPGLCSRFLFPKKSNVRRKIKE